jgi:hypothetical protein
LRIRDPRNPAQGWAHPRPRPRPHRPPLVAAPPATDNLWDIDGSSFFPPAVNGLDAHGASFVTDATIALRRQILNGLDRGGLDSLGLTEGKALDAVNPLLPSRTEP